MARALEVEEDSLEARQVQASLLISQQRKPEAAQYVRHVGQQLLEMRNAANDEEEPNEGEQQNPTNAKSWAVDSPIFPITFDLNRSNCDFGVIGFGIPGGNVQIAGGVRRS